MSYTNIFGGTTVYPSDVSYLALALDADVTLEWPLENSGEAPPAARIIDVTPDASTWAVSMPNATLTGAGQTVLFNNLSVTDSFEVKDYIGGTLATVGAGEQWQVYLAATTTAAGTWRVFRYGASTATVQPSALAGFGLVTTGATLSQSLPVTTFNTSGLTLAVSNRASAFVWDGTGSGTLNLPTVAAAGNNFFVFIRNAGGGDLIVDPAGTDAINGALTLVLRPGDSATLITDGLEWYTIGLGQEPVFAFDYTSITVTGGTKTLTGSELNRIAYNFVGTLAADQYIILPSTVQQYWITNGTSGPFNLFFQTASGTPVQINQGARGIYYCDGVNLVLASDPLSITTPLVISEGGTGSTTASGARLSLGITAFADPIVTASNAAAVRTVINAAGSGANTDITSISGLTTPLNVAQGGTGSATASGARTNLGAAASGTNTDITTLNPAAGLQVGTPTGGAQGAGTINAAGLFVNGAAVGTGSGSVTSVALSGGTTGLTASGSPITTSGTITLGGTLAAANGGTGQTTYSNGQLLIGNGTGLTKATLTAGSGITITNGAGSISIAATAGGGGTVTSVALSGGTTGLTVTGSPITTSGTITLAGTLVAGNGGTGRSTLTANSLLAGNGTSAVNLIAPSTSGNVLTSNGTAWVSSPLNSIGLSDGTAAAPSLYFNAESGTGVYRPSASTLGFAVGGVFAGSITYTASGEGNVKVGDRAGTSASGTRNVAVGSWAGFDLTSANNTTLIGASAGANITTASGSTFVGFSAGANVTTAQDNTALGYNAGSTITSGSNNTCLGNEAQPSSATVSNTITLGNASIATLRCQVTTITSLSDARDKTDVAALDAGLAFINALNPVRFTWDARDPDGKHGEADTGFIAQDLKAAQEQLGIDIPGLVYADNPDKLEAGYGKLLPVLVKAIQELSAKVEALEAQLGG
ncbi:MAG: hypothetical protein RLZZ387_2567 [Chloroflexota bacterium]